MGTRIGAQGPRPGCGAERLPHGNQRLRPRLAKWWQSNSQWAAQALAPPDIASKKFGATPPWQSNSRTGHYGLLSALAARPLPLLLHRRHLLRVAVARVARRRGGF